MFSTSLITEISREQSNHRQRDGPRTHVEYIKNVLWNMSCKAARLMKDKNVLKVTVELTFQKLTVISLYLCIAHSTVVIKQDS